jgi:NACalpha-BTF3-like transcription factor
VDEIVVVQCLDRGHRARDALLAAHGDLVPAVQRVLEM